MTRTYRGVLADLLPSLSSEAQTLPAGRWAARLLPHGALVSVRYTEGRRELRIARPTRPETVKGKAAWGREVMTFLAHFEVAWPSMEVEPTTGIAVVFQEPVLEGVSS